MELPEGCGRAAAAGRDDRNTPTTPPGKPSARRDSLSVAPTGRTVEARGEGDPGAPSAV